MNHPKPPPQTLGPDDERKIQIFLERASSIVLERPVLDLAHWRRLVSLAEELGLSDEELRGTVDDLRQRGVIARIDLSPPKPPPLPNRQQGSKPEMAVESGPERDFLLTPPVPPPPPTSSGDGDADTPSSSGTPPPLRETFKTRVADLSHDERLRQFVERAQAIIAQQRGFGMRTQTLLATTASQLGLDEQEAIAALQPFGEERAMPIPPPPPPNRLGQRDADAAGGTSLDEPLQDHRRWRVEGAPPPEPPPPARKPEAIYRDYLSASLAQITDGVVPDLLERKFVKHGTGVLGLAPTFARHLVDDEAAGKGLRFETDLEDIDLESAAPAGGSQDGGLYDTNVKEFLERSVPILAQQRGINAKSRVLLNALATELGLSGEQVERAIAATQFRATTACEDNDALQQERLVGFRELVQGALISLPRKLLTFDINENLRRHGEDCHGIKPNLVASTIREICTALGIRQISEQESRQHIEHLVDTKLAENARLPADVRTRIESEAMQWGLNALQVTAIIKERTRLHDKRNQAERNFTHGALLAASITMLIVAGFFGWVAMRGSEPRPLPDEAATEAIRSPVPLVVDDANVDTDWWGEELEFAISAGRRELRSQRPLLIQIESKDPAVRRMAYGQLVARLFDKDRDAPQRELLIRVISLCYARDPDPPTARQLLDDLVARIPRSEGDLQSDDAFYTHVFLAAQGAVRLVGQAADQRQRDAATELGRVIGRTIDGGLDSESLRRFAYEGVAERLYRLLIALARNEPARVASAQAVIARHAAVHLDSAKLEKLNADFLVVVLSAASHTWREYESLIRDTVGSTSPINVVRMLEVYEETKDVPLQEFLADALIARIGKSPESRDVASVANAVRKSLGVAADDVDNKPLTRFLVGANSLLAEPRADASEPEALLAETVNFAYYAALGCAVAQDSAGTTAFDVLAAQDPAAFLTLAEPSMPLERDESDTLEPTTLRMLNDRLRMLLNPRTSRFSFIESIARNTDRVRDLAPDQAALLATYLLGKKRVEEHRAILPHVETLRKWKQLRLAVADQLEDAAASGAQLSEIISKLLGREVELGKGQEGREALRVELLRDVLADVKREDISDQNRYQVYDNAARALYDFYQTQANLLHVPEWPDDPVTPTAVLRAMIESRVKTLLDAKVASQAKASVEQIDVQLRAIDYAAANDFQKLVLLDRLWLRLLAVECMVKHPDRQAAADSLVEHLAVRDRGAQHVLSQLRDGNEAILRMWLVLNQRAN